MSLPTFPTNEPPLTREDVINQIISSIAMEELGLSHIINAEGEKLQYAMGTIPEVAGPTEPATIDDLLELNKSVRETLDGTMLNQMFLKAKLQSALSASIMQGPTGPTGEIGPMGPGGPTGPTGAGLNILNYYESLAALKAAQGTGNKGDVYVAGGLLYISDGTQWIQVDNLGGPTGPAGPMGATGPTGPTGSGMEILNYYETLQELIDARGFGNRGDVYVAEGFLYVSDGTQWIKMENLGGPTGPTGPTGDGLKILDYFADLEALKAAHGTGAKGDVYVAGGVLYISDGTQWIELENLGGPTGATGPAGVGLTILGYYDTLADLIADEGMGNEGDVFVVGGLLYISNGAKWIPVENLGGPTGSTGPVGPTGPAALSYTVIPFSSQRGPKVYANSSGEPTRIVLLGFGYMDVAAAIFPDVSIPVDASDGSFNLGNVENRQVVFSLPFAMKLSSIYATVGNYGRFVLPPSGTKVFPCVQIYSAEPNSNLFKPIPLAYARPDEGIDPKSAEAATMRAASKAGLSIELEAGTRIAIGGLMAIDGDSAARDYYMYFTGGIGLTPWIR